MLRVIVTTLLPEGCFLAEHLPQLPEEPLCKATTMRKAS